MVEYLKVDSMKPIKGIEIQHIIENIVSQCKEKDPMERITYEELLFYMKLLKELIASPWTLLPKFLLSFIFHLDKFYH